jgi:hypothetical protein
MKRLATINKWGAWGFLPEDWTRKQAECFVDRLNRLGNGEMKLIEKDDSEKPTNHKLFPSSSTE